MYYDGYIRKINQLLQSDKTVRESERQRPAIADAAIAQTLSVDDFAVSAPKIWHEYRIDVVDLSPYSYHLHIRAKQDFVVSVVWRQPGQQAEVKLYVDPPLDASKSRRGTTHSCGDSANTPITFIVAPLRPVLDLEQDDEICERDLVVLVGKYVRVSVRIARQYFMLTTSSSLSLAQQPRLKASQTIPARS